MRWLLAAVGTLRAPLREVCDDYLRRMRRTLMLSEVEVRAAGTSHGSRPARGASPGDPREVEGRRLLSAVPDRTRIVVLDRRGEAWSSEMLAAQIEAWRVAASDRAFVLGGADGISASVRRRAETCWSLGPLTLPHELARVVVIEQLYRATTILRGTPYHRGDTPRSFESH